MKTLSAHAAQDRLKALASYEIIGTDPEPLYDSFVRIGAQMCGTGMAALVFVGERHEWCKARPGVEAEDTAAVCSFARDVMVRNELLENIAVPGVRFLSGVPLVSLQGHALGAVCVMSDTERPLTREQRNGLTALAAAIAQALDIRRQLRGSARETRTAHEQIALLRSAIDVAATSSWFITLSGPAAISFLCT